MTYTRSTWDFKQPNSKQLDLFISQLVDQAVQTSTISLLTGAYVAPFYRYPSEQELKTNNINTNCIITVQHDQDTQALYPDDSISLAKKLDYWIRPYVINATVKNIVNSQDMSEQIIEIQDELIDLLCFNDGEYTNSGTLTETFKNRPLHNTLLEKRIFWEDTTNRPSHYYVTLTILFTIYK